VCLFRKRRSFGSRAELESCTEIWEESYKNFSVGNFSVPISVSRQSMRRIRSSILSPWLSVDYFAAEVWENVCFRRASIELLSLLAPYYVQSALCRSLEVETLLSTRNRVGRRHYDRRSVSSRVHYQSTARKCVAIMLYRLSPLGKEMQVEIIHQPRRASNRGARMMSGYSNRLFIVSESPQAVPECFRARKPFMNFLIVVLRTLWIHRHLDTEILTSWRRGSGRCL